MMDRFFRWARRAGIAVVCITTLAPGAVTGQASASGGDFPPANGFAVALYRTDPATLGTPWAMTIIAQFDFVPGVTGVTVGIPNGMQLALNPGDPNEWNTTLAFPVLADMLDAADGTWTIAVSGSSASTTEFTLAIGGFTDADFFDFPIILSPANGSTVPVDTNFTWIDPTGPETAEAVAIEVNSPNTSQFVSSLDDPITVDSVEWDPPLLFEPGVLSTAGLFYIRFGNATTVSPYTVTSGDIQWDDAVTVPPDYPAETPRFFFGSANVTGFFASGVGGGPGDVSGDGQVNITDLLLVIAAWGPCPNCPEDIDEDGFVAISDLLIVLGNWSG